MVNWLSGLGILGAGGYWGYKNGRQDKLDKNTKRFIISASLLAGTAVGAIYGPETVRALYAVSQQVNSHEFGNFLIKVDHYNLNYIFGGVNGLVGSYINLGFGYLVGKGIGKIAGKKEQAIENPNKERLTWDSKNLEQRITDPEYVLKKRLASGEITSETYKELREIIKN